jgi:hypothetical protein
MIEGQITNVVDRVDGSELVSDVAVGATTIIVHEPIDFDEDDGGELRIWDDTNSEVKSYTVLDADAGTIQLASGLANAYIAGTRVDLYPKVTERWAFLMEEEDQDQELEARVPHGLFTLIPRGPRNGNGEIVEADWRGEDLVVIDKLYEEPVMDGSYIDPATVPPADGTPPSSSPAPTVEGGPGYLFARWPLIDNNDTVTYEVHLSTATGFTPDPSTKYGETHAGSIVINKTAAGGALAYGTTYFVKLIAKDADGAAAAGSQGSGSMIQIGNPDLANLSVGTAQIQNLAVTDGKINTLSASKLTAGTIDASVITVTNLDASNLTSGNIATARLTTNVLAALQANVSNLQAIVADLGTVNAGILRSSSSVTWAGNAAGLIMSATNNGIRAFNGTRGTYEVRGSDGAVAVGGLLSATGIQRIEILPTGMALYEQTSGAISSPPTTGGGNNAAIAWATLNIAAVGATQSLISGVTNSTTPTITTATSHGLTTGDTVEIRGVQSSGTPPNGYYTATVTNATQFTIGTVASTGTYTASTGAVVKVSPKGQFTTSTDTSQARMWFDYQGLHSQYQNASLNQGAPFRTFDFNPADANGLRLHTSSTPDAIRVNPINGITFKLAVADNPGGDLAARWVRQSNGALAAAVWGDNLGDDTINGQINAYGYAANTSGVGQVRLQGQVGTSTSPTRYANMQIQGNLFGTSSGITVRAVQTGDTGNLTLINDGGSSHWVQGTIQGGTGISVTNGAGGISTDPSVAIDTSVVPRLGVNNTFTAQQQISPASDVNSLVVRRGTDTSPTADLTRWNRADNGAVLASIDAFGHAGFPAGIETKVVAGAVSDANFGATPASGAIAVDSTNSRIYVRVGATWKLVGVGSAPAATFTLPSYTANRTATAPASVTLSELARTVYTLIDDLKTLGELK